MRRRKKYVAWVFLGPSLIIYLYFFIYPTISAFRISLYKWSGFTQKMKFVGFKNFIRLVGDDSFYSTLSNTFIILIIGGILIFLITFGFSLILNSGVKGKKIFRNIL